MSEQHPYRSIVTPIPDGQIQPLWSVMIPTYNCANYLRETLTSVLAQDPGAVLMQIEVVDDCSTEDDPEAVVRELAGDRVNFYRQPQNVGHAQNFQTCLARSRGKLVHLLHGDDCVLNGFYAKLQQTFQTNPEIGAAFCRHIYMDDRGHWQEISSLLQPESGLLNNWLERIVAKQYIQAPSIVVKREVYERMGGFDRRFKYYYEDWEMWVRIATQYPVWYEVEPLATYRLRSASNSGRSIRTGENIQDVRRGLEIVRSYLPNYLPQTTIAQLLAQNREHTAFYAIRTANQLLAIADLDGALAQMNEAIKCSNSWKIIRWVIPFFIKAGIMRAWQVVNIAN